MSWSDVFPVMDDEAVDRFATATKDTSIPVDRNWFAIEKILSTQPDKKHLVATSLFWKRDNDYEDDLPVINLKNFINAKSLGLAVRNPPWETYVRPLVEAAMMLREQRSDAVIRVYLANDLEFIAEFLAESGCEIYLMKTSSIRHNPGAMWRFLALEEVGRAVTIIDADNAEHVLADIARTETAMAVGVGGWRTPYYYEQPSMEGYRPINASQFGSNRSYPMRQLMEAFVWLNLNGLIRTSCILHGLRESPIAGTRWPNYGFDEWFLLAGFYPRMAADGLLTFYPWDWNHIGQFLALDIEYCTWANPSSELINYPNIEVGVEGEDPWAGWEDSSRLRVRPQTTVIRRVRTPVGPACALLRAELEELEGFPKYHGNFVSLLRQAAHAVTEPWWVDLNPRLNLVSHGGELFLDRRYENADVVYCGSYFLKITTAIAEWAKRNQLHGGGWQEGHILKLPKLEGPMTLWRTSFSKTFHEELTSCPPFITADILLKAWMERGKVVFAEATAAGMGWNVR